MAEDADAASSVVLATYEQLGSSGWSDENRENFYREVAPGNLKETIGTATYAAVAEVNQVVVGFALMPRPSLLRMLFVAPSYQRRGIARALWERARDFVESGYSDVKTVELNSTPYALPFYRSVGFAPISKEFIFKGVRATRMAIWLPSRGLDAENTP